MFNRRTNVALAGNLVIGASLLRLITKISMQSMI